MQFHNDGSFKLLVIKSIYRNKHHLGFAGVSKLKKKWGKESFGMAQDATKEIRGCAFRAF